MRKLHAHMSQTAQPHSDSSLLFVTHQCRIGEYVVIPAHSSGATPARFRFGGTLSANASSTTMLSNNPRRSLPPGACPEVVSQGQILAELLETGLALRCRSIRINHASHGGKVPDLELAYRRTGPRNAPTISCPGTHGYTVGITSFHSSRT